MHPAGAGSGIPTHAKALVIPSEVHEPLKWKANASLSRIYPQHGPGGLLCCPKASPMSRCSHPSAIHPSRTGLLLDRDLQL